MPDRTSKRKILIVAVVLSLVCSTLVTVTAVALRPVQQENKQVYRQANILQVAGLWQEEVPIAEQIKYVATRMVDLEFGWFTDAVDAADYDQYQAAADPEFSIALTPAQDIAGIKRRVRYAPVYLARDQAGQLQTIILPVHGYGLYSTLHGFLAIAADTNTVVGLTFYEHAETPGLGGEVDNPRWKALWPGKKVYDAHWEPAIQVLKGRVDPQSDAAVYQVDGLSGATLTARGVQQLLRFWLGEQGFGPFLDNLRIIGEP